MKRPVPDNTPISTQDFIEVVDDRKHNFFQIDNEVIDFYLEYIAPGAYAIYSLIVRWCYGNRTVPRQWARKVSLTQLCKNTGLSRPRVVECIRTLEQAGLITKETVTDGVSTNRYRVLDVPKRGSEQLATVLEVLKNMPNLGGRSSQSATESDTETAPQTGATSNPSLLVQTAELVNSVNQGSKASLLPGNPVLVNSVNQTSKPSLPVLVNSVNHKEIHRNTLSLTETGKTTTTGAPEPKTNANRMPSVGVVVASMETFFGDTPTPAVSAPPSNTPPPCPSGFSDQETLTVQKLERAGVSCKDAQAFVRPGLHERANPIPSDFEPDMPEPGRRLAWLSECVDAWTSVAKSRNGAGKLITDGIREGRALPPTWKNRKSAWVASSSSSQRIPRVTPPVAARSAPAPTRAPSQVEQKIAAERTRLEALPVEPGVESEWDEVKALAHSRVTPILRNRTGNPAYIAAYEGELQSVIAERLGLIAEVA